MFTTLLTLLALVTPSANAAAPASCMGLTGQALQVCNEQRAAEQAAKIAATKRQLDALEATCSQVCTDAPAAPSAPKKTSTGPSKTQLAIEDLRRRVTELETLTAGGVVSDQELEVELTAINAEITTINGTLDDHERRIKALEDAEPAIVAPPMLVEGPVGLQGPAGANGRDGRDGRPAEITALVGLAGLHSSELSLVGAEVTLRVGGRPSRKLGLGGYGSGIVLGSNDLGYGVGGYLTVDATSWFSPGLSVGWSEIGLDIESDGARRVVQGMEGVVNLEFRPTRLWVVGGDLGAHFSGEGTAFVWGVNAGLRF